MATQGDYRSWDELVFENRNKEYGAFVLRRSYDDKVMLGMLAALGVLLMVLLIPAATPQEIRKVIPKGTVFVVDKEPLIYSPPKPVQPQPPRRQPARQNVNTLTTPQIVQAPVIDAPTPTVDEPVASGDVNTNGTTESTVTEAVTGASAPATNTGYMIAPEVKPHYAGGMEGMARYLTKAIKYPPAAKRMGIEGTVFVSFIVRPDGSVSDVELVKGFHPDCDAEALRVIGKMPGWTAGMHGGISVPVKMVLPIKFTLR